MSLEEDRREAAPECFATDCGRGLDLVLVSEEEVEVAVSATLKCLQISHPLSAAAA